MCLTLGGENVWNCTPGTVRNQRIGVDQPAAESFRQQPPDARFTHAAESHQRDQLLVLHNYDLPTEMTLFSQSSVFTRNGGRSPCSAATTLLTAMIAIRVRVGTVALATCGVTIAFGRVSSAWSA